MAACKPEMQLLSALFMAGQVAVAMLVKYYVMLLGIHVKHENIRVMKA